MLQPAPPPPSPRQLAASVVAAARLPPAAACPQCPQTALRLAPAAAKPGAKRPPGHRPADTPSTSRSGQPPTAAPALADRREAWAKTGIISLRDLGLTDLPDDLFAQGGGGTARRATGTQAPTTLRSDAQRSHPQQRPAQRTHNTAQRSEPAARCCERSPACTMAQRTHNTQHTQRPHRGTRVPRAVPCQHAHAPHAGCRAAPQA